MNVIVSCSWHRAEPKASILTSLYAKLENDSKSDRPTRRDYEKRSPLKGGTGKCESI
jgi:hypothetical protein